MTPLASSASLDANPRIADWLDFSRNDVVVLKTGKVEIGQGIITALVQLASDELDVSAAQFEVISGHTAQGPAEAGTSSSLSIEVGGRAVRLAASAARRVLLAEAAKLLQAPIEGLRIEGGRVLVGDRPTDLTWWSLAPSVDLTQTALEHARPKPPSERRAVGVALPRLDLAAKATGPAFIHDLELPGMLHGRVVQPSARGRRIVHFDADAFSRRCPDAILVRDGSFLGLIAPREELAIRAAAIASGLVKWSDDASGLTNWETASQSDSSRAEIVFGRGEAPQSVTGRRIATQIMRPYIAHASLAPSCAIAKWEDDRLLVHTHSQSVQDLRTGLSLAFKIEPDKIVVVHSPGAGTYGHSGQDDVAYEAALLAKAAPGTPIRVLWARAEDFTLSPLGPGMLVSASATLDASGGIRAFEIESTGQAHVNRPGRGGTPNFIAGDRLEARLSSSRPADVGLERGGGLERNAIPLYAIPNVRVSKRVLCDLPYRTSALRSLGGFANVFALETLMDDVAAEIGADSAQLRLDHLDNERAKAVIRKAAEMAGWPGAAKAGEGLGLAFAQYKNRSAYCAVVVRAVVDEHVRLTHAWSAVDVGEVINPDGVINQIEGAILQSASWALHERVVFEGDAVATVDWAGYPVLKFSEVPEIDVSIIARPEEPPLGVGEGATAPTAAAIGNAVRRALGVRIRRLPITREAIMEAIG